MDEVTSVKADEASGTLAGFDELMVQDGDVYG